MGLSGSLVQDAIEKDLPNVLSKIKVGDVRYPVITIEGIQYTAFKLCDGTINAGRINGIK